MSRKRNNNDLYICVKRIKNALKIIFYFRTILRPSDSLLLSIKKLF